MTSPVERVTVECPRCGSVFEDWTRASINVSLDPEIAADEEYLRACSTATCPSCGAVTSFDVLIADFDGVPRTRDEEDGENSGPRDLQARLPIRSRLLRQRP